MTDNLTNLISRIQARLLDTGAVFSTATCTSALRAALGEFNASAPNSAAVSIEAIPGKREYPLDDAAFAGLLSVRGVWREGVDEALIADVYFEGNVPFFRLREAQADGTLVVRITLSHTISGLDGAIESTLTTDQDQVLVEGACAMAITSRLVARVETLNLAPEVVANYKQAAEMYRRLFELGLALYAARGMAVGVPDARAWNDAWHGWA